MTIAQADADAAKIKDEGQATTYQVDADGQRKLNEARNAMSDKVIDFELARGRLRIIPLAVRVMGANMLISHDTSNRETSSQSATVPPK